MGIKREIVGILDWCHENTSVSDVEVLAELCEFDKMRVRITIERLPDKD